MQRLRAVLKLRDLRACLLLWCISPSALAKQAVVCATVWEPRECLSWLQLPRTAEGAQACDAVCSADFVAVVTW